MDAKLKDKWLTALRSGEYKQCTATLRSSDNCIPYNGFCCLGVLCDVIDSSNWIGDTAKYKFNDSITFTDRLASEKDKWGTSYILPEDIQFQLTRLNDSVGLTFSEIADWIEDNIEVQL